MKENIKPIVICIIMGIVICSLIIQYKVYKKELRDTIVSERKNTAINVEKSLPGIIVNDTEYIKSAKVTVDLQDSTYNYKNSDGSPAKYYDWNDNIKLVCEAADKFNSVPPKTKLQFFKDLSARAEDEYFEIQKNVAPTYLEHLTTSGIRNVFDETVFCAVNVEISVKAGSEKYTYNRYSYHISEAYYHNGVEEPKVTYTKPASKTNKTRPQTNSTNNNFKNNNNSSNKKKYKHVDSYDDGYEDVYMNGDYDWDRYCNDWDYASGVDDALDDEGWDF